MTLLENVLQQDETEQMQVCLRRPLEMFQQLAST